MPVYNKLVRDGVPAAIRADGKRCRMRTLGNDEFRHALLAKLVEEATEVAAAPPEERAGELADLLEVVDALMTASNITAEDVERLRRSKAALRGVFANRVFLESVDG